MHIEHLFGRSGANRCSGRKVIQPRPQLCNRHGRCAQLVPDLDRSQDQRGREEVRARVDHL